MTEIGAVRKLDVESLDVGPSIQHQSVVNEPQEILHEIGWTEVSTEEIWYSWGFLLGWFCYALGILIMLQLVYRIRSQYVEENFPQKAKIRNDARSLRKANRSRS